MPFPEVVAVNGGNNNTDSTSHTVNLPAGIQAGDLLLVFFVCDAPATVDITFPEGWTLVIERVTFPQCKTTCYKRIADGGEGATITVTTSVAEKSAHTSYRIISTTGTTQGISRSGTDDSPDPPNLIPVWGAKDTLWFAATGYDYNRTITSYPTNYTDGRNDIADSTTGCGMGTARRELNAASEDPGVFTLSAADGWGAFTVGIEPATIAYKDVATRFKLEVLGFGDVITRFRLWVLGHKDTSVRFGLSLQTHRDVSTRFFLHQPTWEEFQMQKAVAALKARIEGLGVELRARFRI